MLEIVFTLDNAAFADDPRPEIVRILRKYADQLERDETDGHAKLRDINGNTVGDAWLTLEDD